MLDVAGPRPGQIRKRLSMLFEPIHLAVYASGPRARSGIVNARLATQSAPSRPPVRLGFEVRAVGSTRSIT